MDLPKDGIMLLSVINLKLRDDYSSLDVLCEEMGLSKEEIVSKLAAVDYEYDEIHNQFI